MPKQITQYEILLSCPGDIQDELKYIEQAIDKFNQQFSKTLGVSLLLRHWGKSGYSQSGGKPQAILNKQFVDNCDLAIALFWTRFGTPTDLYGSGSEEEIELMLSQKKQVFMYFCDKQIEPSKMDYKQYNRVQKFRKKYESRGLFYSYKTNEEFMGMIYAHLTQYFLTLEKIEKIEANKPRLKIKSIGDKGISSYAEIGYFDFDGVKGEKDRIEEIKGIYQIINHIKLPKAMTAGNVMFRKNVVIDDKTKQLIGEIAKTLKIGMTMDFFSLGDLQEDILSSNGVLGFGKSIVGSVDAKEKYDMIKKLKEAILDAFAWNSLENCYGGNLVIKFVVENEGQSYDEDIDISLLFPKGVLLKHKMLKIPPEHTFDDLLEGCSEWDIFTIPASINNITYEESCYNKVQVRSKNIETGLIFGKNKDYSEKYMDTLDDIFEYRLYDTQGGEIVKLHMDYIKQHSIVAFPTPLFINKADDYGDIKYSITSKHSPDVLEGTIRINDKTNNLYNVDGGI